MYPLVIARRIFIVHMLLMLTGTSESPLSNHFILIHFSIGKFRSQERAKVHARTDARNDICKT